MFDWNPPTPHKIRLMGWTCAGGRFQVYTVGNILRLKLVCGSDKGVLMRLKGVGRGCCCCCCLGSLQEPDLVETVAVGGVGVAGHDERVVDAHAGRVEELRHGIDLADDGHLVGGAGEGPEMKPPHLNRARSPCDVL